VRIKMYEMKSLMRKYWKQEKQGGSFFTT
jgi:hypothetical protein